MRNDLKKRINRLAESNTLKHLRGRHDQRDHAWNRGMGGRSGGYAPGYMNQTEFQALKKNLQAQIEAGEITQEYGEAIWTTAQRLMQEDYDRANPRVGDELSRRESTIETLANRRRNIRPNISASDISLNTTIYKMANANAYSGQGFNSFWSAINDSSENITQAERDELNQLYPSISGRDQTIFTGMWGQDLVNVIDDFHQVLVNLHFMQTQSSTQKQIANILVGTRPFMENAPPETSGDEDSIYQYFASVYQQGWPRLHEQIVDASGRADIAPLFEYQRTEWQKALDFFESLKPEMFELSDEQLQSLTYTGFDDLDRLQQDAFRRDMIRFKNSFSTEDIMNFVNATIKKIKFDMKMLNPQVWFALNAFFSSGKKQNAFNKLDSNTAYPTFLFEMDSILDGSGKDLSDSEFEQVLSAAVLRSTIYTNNRIGNAYSYNSDYLQTLLNAVNQNEPIRRQINSSLQLPLDSDLNADTFNVPLFKTAENMDRSSYFSNRGVSSLTNELRTNFSDALKQRIGLQGVELSFASPDQKETALRIYSDMLDRINISLRPYTDGRIDPNQIAIAKEIASSLFSTDIRYVATQQELLDIFRQSANNNGTMEFASDYIARVENEIEQQRLSQERDRLATLPIQDRYDQQMAFLQQDLDKAINESDDVTENLIKQAMDDLDWQMIRYRQNDLFRDFTDAQMIRWRLDNQNFRSIDTRLFVESQLISAQQERRNDIRRLRDRAFRAFRSYNLDSGQPALAHGLLSDHLKDLIEFNRSEGMIDIDIVDEIHQVMNTFIQDFPQIDFSNEINYINQELGNSAQYTPPPSIYDQTAPRREEAWQGRTPVLVENDSIVNKDDSIFGSPAFAYGNPVADKNNDLPPDNPDDVPLFNPRYARFGAREIIDQIEANPQSLFDLAGDPDAEIQLRENLSRIGYSSELINKILENINEKLTALPRDKTRYRIGVESQFDSTILDISFSTNDVDIDSSGFISIKFERDPSASTIKKKVGMFRIPDKADNGAPNKYKGAAAPLLMYSGDQMRRIGYALGTNKVRYAAQAVNIDNRDAQLNSGPTTWPVLGAAVSGIYPNPQLTTQLLNMGYSREFVEYVQTLREIPAHLFFLNAPPSIFVRRPTVDNPSIFHTIRINTTSQALWSELYGNGLPSSYNVDLNLGAPNEAGRLYNFMIPGATKPTSVEKELVQLSRIKSFIKNFKAKRL